MTSSASSSAPTYPPRPSSTPATPSRTSSGRAIDAAWTPGMRLRATRRGDHHTWVMLETVIDWTVDACPTSPVAPGRLSGRPTREGAPHDRRHPRLQHADSPKIMTPDSVATRLGTLEFFDGMPTDATTARSSSSTSTFLAGVEVFLDRPGGVARGDAPGNESWADRREQGRHLRRPDGLQLAVPDRQHRHRVRPRGPRPRPDGPTVVEIPPGLRTGHGRRRVVPVRHRHGRTRPRPRAGRQVPDPPARLRRRVPDGYFSAASPSYVNWIVLRGFLVDGRPDRRVEDVPGRRQDLPARRRRRSAGDGVPQRVRPDVQHDPRQQRRVLRRSCTPSSTANRST